MKTPADALLEMAASQGSAEDIREALDELFPNARSSQFKDIAFRHLVKELFPQRDLHQVISLDSLSQILNK